MAIHGARHIIVSSRSGIEDEASVRIVDSCRVHGCKVTEAKGDIGDVDFIRRLFKTANSRIAGIIQGAMVLKVSPLFKDLVLDSYPCSHMLSSRISLSKQ